MTANAPRRIVSLVPSLTELLADLGLEDEVVGITKFCVHPERWFHSKPRVGGTKTVNVKTVKDLRPDLVIANREENVKEQVESLQAFAPVFVSDISNLRDALIAITEIGRLTNREEEATCLKEEIETNFQAIANPNYERSNNNCAYFIWKDPWMVAGGGTFIDDMLHLAGFSNVFSARPRYPIIDADALCASNCKVILLSSEPYPFREQHISEFKELCPKARICLVDGEMFSWYGSRLKYTPLYISELHKKLA